ncbi:cytochrome P450 736A117-like [Macadamia integrifolia]|uniref:cytochrome P450 736A117-like n=1 Tax=Macadamia integrifolia TaxID=60698 RepID=UPI001C4F638D|nr:cytochrome P450 736A117-like [Macadamia integrifolia]
MELLFHYSIGQLCLLHPFSLLLCFLLLFVFLFIRNNNRSVGTKKGNNPPPSPWKLPIIGNLHQLGSLPHRGLHSLAQSHGPLMLLHFGSKPTLVVSSPDAAREILKTHDLIFSSRPDSSFPRRLLYNHKDIAFAPYGEYWRQVRKICVLQLLSMKSVQSFQPVREEETKAMIKNIQKSCSSLPSFSALVDLSEVLLSLTNDITCRVALGKKYGGEEGCGKRFKKMIDEFVYLLGVFNVGDFITWLGWVNYVIGLEERVEKNFAEIDSFLDQVIEDHIHGKRKKNGDHNDADGGGQDFVDFLLRVQQDETAEITLGRDHLKGIIMDMFSAGTETTSTLLEWTMARLLKHPEVMNEVQKEIRRVASATGRAYIIEDDIEEMHYLKAVIKETLRLHPPGPLLIPRESTKDAKIKGYDIPAKTTVIINAWAIGRDPASWDDPEEFKPKRFCNDTSSIDFKGHDFQLIPFGAGRRGCPGTHFASAVVELALANLLHKFDWALPNGANGDALDDTEAPGLSCRLKSPLLAIATTYY